MTRAGHRLVLLAAIACLPALAPSGAGAVEPLVLSTADAPGLHAVPAHVQAARDDLLDGLPRRLKAPVRRAQLELFAAAGHGQQLRSDAFILTSARTAARVLSGWRRARRAASVDVGGDQAALAHPRGGPYVVVFAVRSRVGVIVLRAARGVRAPEQLALRYAAAAADLLSSTVPTTKWGRVLEQIRPDGTLSKQTALEAFAVAYGRLPGVQTPSGAKATITSATLASQWILHYRAKLSKRQNAIVERYLGLPAPGRSAHTASLGDPGFTQNTELQDWADMFIGDYEKELDYQFHLHVVAGYTSSALFKNAYADALPLNALLGNRQFGPKSYCRVRVSEAATSGKASEFVELLVAHEVFHCFQFQMVGLYNWSALPAWIGEGTADWAALTVDPVSYNIGGGNIAAYITTPSLPLYGRAYDAVGFFGHIADTVPGGLWPRLYDVITAHGDDAAFDAAGGNLSDFLTSWGSSVFNLSGASPSWTMRSPVAPPLTDNYRGTEIDVTAASVAVAAPTRATSQYFLVGDGSPPIVEVAIDGPARLGRNLDITNLSDAYFCFADDVSDCQCPDDEEGSVPATTLLPGGAYTVALGLANGASGFVTGHSLDQYCHPKPCQGPAADGADGDGDNQCPAPGQAAAVSDGDPHLQTASGRQFDFQGAGEYTLERSANGRFDIQARDQPVAPSAQLATGSFDVSVSTAIAMRVGTNVVEVDRGSPLVIRLSRRVIALPEGTSRSLPGGGELLHLAPGADAPEDSVVVQSPDGSVADVSSFGAVGIGVIVDPAPSLAPTLRGLLGEFGGTGKTLLGGDGKRYATSLVASDTPAGFHARYDRYGNSWRISQSQSLFYYPHGESSRTFTNRRFPQHPTPLSALPAKLRRGAERICERAGVSAGALLSDCEFDVASTGNRGFAKGARTVEAIASGETAAAWTELSSGAPVGDVSLLDDQGHTLAAFVGADDHSVHVSSFTAGGSGIGAVSNATAVAGLTGPAAPVLFGAAGGGAQMLLGSETYGGYAIAPVTAAGFAGAPVPAAQSEFPGQGLGGGAVLSSDGSTPIWPATVGPVGSSGDLFVYRGGAHATPTDLSSYAGVDSEPTAVTVAKDSTGRLWLAWTGDSGIAMLALDPATGTPIPGAQPVLVPGSQPNLAFLLVCSATCRILYRTSPFGSILSWAPGEAGPTTIGGANGFPFAAAYASDGQLWVVYGDGPNEPLIAKLGNASGAGGKPIKVPTAPGTPVTGLLSAYAIGVGNRLVLVEKTVSAMWATVVAPAS